MPCRLPRTLSRRVRAATSPPRPQPQGRMCVCMCIVRDATVNKQAQGMSQRHSSPTALPHAHSPWRRIGTRCGSTTTMQGNHMVADSSTASNRPTPTPRATSPARAHLDLRLRHDPGAAVDRQQPCEYVRTRPPCRAWWLTMRQGPRHVLLRPSPRAIHVLSRTRTSRRARQAIPLLRQGHPLRRQAERPLLAPPRPHPLAPDVCCHHPMPGLHQTNRS